MGQVGERGGSWINNPRNCRSAYRNYNSPDNRNNNIGFRVVCSAPRTLQYQNWQVGICWADWEESRLVPVMRLTNPLGTSKNQTGSGSLVSLAEALPDSPNLIGHLLHG